MSHNYAIDTDNGNELMAGLQGYDYARQAAQWLANERGEPVYLYKAGDRHAAGDDGMPSEEILPEDADFHGQQEGTTMKATGPDDDDTEKETCPECGGPLDDEGGCPSCGTDAP